MKLRDAHLLALGGLTLFSLPACNARLAVLGEPLPPAGTGGSGGSEGSGVTPANGGTGAGSPVEQRTCGDGLSNGDETDVDCGGSSCPPCARDARCVAAADCVTGGCTEGLCVEPTCDDHIQNGDETGIDCGGRAGCQSCVTSCDCASSESLFALGCGDLPESFVNSGRGPYASDYGSSVAFDLCNGVDCRLSYWTRSDGLSLFPAQPGGVLTAGISGDGRRVLASPQLALATESLLYAPDGSSTSTGLGVSPLLMSANGTSFGLSPVSAAQIHVRRLSPDGQLDDLGILPVADRRQLLLVGAAADGSVLVGYDYDGQRPFRWSEAAGLVNGLPGLPENANGARVSSVSRDGRAFAGVTTLGNKRVSIYRSLADEFVEIGTAAAQPSPEINPEIMSLSDDGSVLAFSGQTNATAGDIGAFRWSEADGRVALAPGIRATVALMSADGTVILGNTVDSDAYRIFVWTAATGARSVRATLEASRVDFTGWTLGSPTVMSRDGRIVYGMGQCGSVSTVYRMTLPE
jgi:hypothetical protein